MSFIRQIITGLKWSAMARYGEHAVGFVTTAILANLLSPAEFGILALAGLVTGFLVSIADLGTATTLIQRESVSRSLEATVFWAGLITATLLAALVWTLAPVFGLFFNEPRVVPVVRVLGLGLVFSGAGAVPTALLTRELAFDRLARVQLTGAMAGGVVGVTMALAGAGVWSLVAQHLVRTGTEAAGALLVTRFSPAAAIDRTALRSVASFGIHLSGFQLTNFLTRNIDNLIIGRFLGATTLGYYDIAWRLIEYPKAALSGVAGRVMVPAYSRLQSDAPRFGRAYVRVVAAIALVSVPALLGLMLVADPLVPLVFGGQWAPAALLVAILAPVGLAQTMGATTGSVYIARGRTDWLFGWSVLAATVTTIAVTAGLAWGVAGVAVARLLANSALFPVNMSISLRLVGLRWRDLWRLLRPVLGAGLSMVAAVALFRVALPAIGAPWPALDLAGSVLVGAAVYTGMIWTMRPPILVDIVTALAAAGSPRARAWVNRLDLAED